MNFRTPSGNWAPIDTTLVTGHGQGQRRRERANSLEVSFALRADAPVLASVGQGSWSYGFGLAGAARATGQASGSRVLYQRVLPESDLALRVTRTGLTDSMTLHSATAPASWVFPLTLSGLSPVLGKKGSVSLVNPAGQVVGLPRPGIAPCAVLSVAWTRFLSSSMVSV